MKPYFRPFPTMFYDSFVDTDEIKLVTDIFRRAKATAESMSDKVIWYDYIISDGESPEILSYNYYNSVNYHWVIILANQIQDPRWDWPLSTRVFDKYIIKSTRLTAILLKLKNKENNSVFIFDKKQIRNIENTEWLEIQCEFQKKFDYSDRRMNPLEDEDHFKDCRAGNIDDFNDIVGFMTEFKKEYIIFKVKDLNKKRNKGARCDQISKKHILPVINKIIKDKEYTNENIIQPGSTKKVSTQQLCCELELILRHYETNK